ncbi:MAG TPA: hypothetical protein VGA99_06510 [bacterium]
MINLSRIRSHSKIREALVIVFVILTSLQVSVLAAGELNRFVFSDNIGNPKSWKPGEVNVGEDIPDVVITAVDANGDRVSSFSGTVYLTQQTDYGIGRISPETVHLVDGQWQGTLRVFRAGTKKSSTGVVGDAWIRAYDGDNAHFGDSPHFCARALSLNRLLILLPGEEMLPGSALGKIGQPHRQYHGANFNIDIYSTDEFWNRVKPNATQKLFFTSDDPLAVLPSYVDLLEGTNTLSVTVQMNTNLKTISVQDITDNGIDAYITPPIVLTNETLHHFEISEIVSPVVAGQPLSITVSARSVSNVLITDFNGYVYLSASTGEGTFSPNLLSPLASGQWTGEITLTRAQNGVVLTVANDITPMYTGASNPFNVVPGDISRLQILLPGQEATPGIAPGRIGAATTQFVNVAFPVEVRVTDAWWNSGQPSNLELHFTASNSEAILPADVTQNIAQASYDVSFTTEGQSRVFVSAVNQGVRSDTSSQFYVDLGLVSHFEFSPIATPQVAGRPFSVQIRAMNTYNNHVTNFNGDIILSASTGNGTISTTGVTLTDGTWEGELYLTAATTQAEVYAADYVAPPNNHTGTSGGFEVVPDTLAGLQVVLPGQTATPGVTPGFKNETLSQVAGVPVNVTVRAVDKFWNLIPSWSDSVLLNSTDDFFMGDKAIELQNGQGQVEVRFRTAAEQRLFASFAAVTGLPTAQSEPLAVSPNTFAQLLLLLPGESILPGDDETDLLRTPGRSGTASTQTAGLPFIVEVVAVDTYWNPAQDVPVDHVHLYITDSQAVVVPATDTLTAGRAQFTVSLFKGGNQVLRAIDDDNSGIQQSPDAIVPTLVGGLHYEINVFSDSLVAGQRFWMQVIYKNGVGDLVPANHLVRMSALSAATFQEVPGNLLVTAINLISGQRTFEQSFDRAVKIRIKVEDDFGTEPAYSDVLDIKPGSVAALNMTSTKTEVRGEEETEVRVTVTDAVGNPTPDKEVQFEIVAGTGHLSVSTVLTDSMGVARSMFRGGRITEVNEINAAVDSIATSHEIVVNLTPSTMADGEVVNYPNPFGVEATQTHIDYYLSEDADVTLKIFDLFGNLVWTAEFAAGMPGGQGRSRNLHPNSVEWRGVNDRGQTVGNGGYILVVKADAAGKVVMNAKRKIVVMR